MDKILIVEDNKDVSNMLKEVLTDTGYEVVAVYTGTDGIREIRQNSYQLVLLDIMLPYKSGDEILKEARGFTDIPIIILSAKDMVGTKIDLLKAGADDYITKPFDLREVAARVESQLRRLRKSEAGVSYCYKDLVLEEDSKSISMNGRDLELTATEYGILELLMKYPGKVFTKANLYDAIWKDSYMEDDNAVKTHISNLRRKLKERKLKERKLKERNLKGSKLKEMDLGGMNSNEPDRKEWNPEEEYIETVWGLGYRLYKDNDMDSRHK